MRHIQRGCSQGRSQLTSEAVKRNWIVVGVRDDTDGVLNIKGPGLGWNVGGGKPKIEIAGQHAVVRFRHNGPMPIVIKRVKQNAIEPCHLRDLTGNGSTNLSFSLGCAQGGDEICHDGIHHFGTYKPVLPLEFKNAPTIHTMSQDATELFSDAKRSEVSDQPGRVNPVAHPTHAREDLTVQDEFQCDPRRSLMGEPRKISAFLLAKTIVSWPISRPNKKPCG